MEELKKINRSSFLKLSALTTGAFLADGLGLPAWARSEPVKLTILHTNDWHSRIDPFPMDGSKFQGQGGAAIRAALIERIRKEEKNVLLLDAGDIVQGTPYYNFFGGEPEIRLMNAMRYDASAIGNHDFDNGIDGLKKMVDTAAFPFLCSNYDFSHTVLSGKVKPYRIFRYDHLKIGVLGIGIDPSNLILPHLFGETIYSDPIAKANQFAAILRHDEKCDFVICLSHIGYKYNEKKISDEQLAVESENIDLIIGGHTHTFLEKPVSFVNKKNELVTVNQVGWAGLRLGRLDYYFHRAGKKIYADAYTVEIHEKTT